MLNHDGNVRLDRARIIRSSRDRSRIFQVVEAQVLRSPRLDIDPIRPDRIAVREVDRDFHVRLLLGRVQQAHSFVARHLRRWPMTLRRNVAFRDCPVLASDWILHDSSEAYRWCSWDEAFHHIFDSFPQARGQRPGTWLAKHVKFSALVEHVKMRLLAFSIEPDARDALSNMQV